VRSSRRSTTLSFTAWRPASRMTTFSTPATVSSQYPLTAASCSMTAQVTPPTHTPISFKAHLLLQHPGPRQLLQKFEQHVSDTCMIEHLRSIKSNTISTDGGLSLIGQGTFGWMLTDAKRHQHSTGSDPVDGPATQASSTRSELHGFAAPLEYIHQLSRYYSMRPEGEYEWECESQCAITRTDVLLNFKQRRRQPYNADITSNLTQRLARMGPRLSKVHGLRRIKMKQATRPSTPRYCFEENRCGQHRQWLSPRHPSTPDPR
jgi:hypothetical protein